MKRAAGGRERAVFARRDAGPPAGKELDIQDVFARIERREHAAGTARHAAFFANARLAAVTCLAIVRGLPRTIQDAHD